MNDFLFDVTQLSELAAERSSRQRITKYLNNVAVTND